MRRFYKEKKGFTLVEVIVVLVIIAILIALLVPALTGYIDKARKKSAMAECRMAVQAAQTLYSDAYGMNASSGVEAVTPDEITALAEVDGTVSQIGVNEGELLHLTYTIDKYVITYCREYKTCEFHEKLYNYMNGESGGAGGDSDDPSGDDATKYIPGTTIKLTRDGWFTWHGDNEWENNTIPAGEVFEYNGNYYITVQEVSLTKGQIESGPDGDVYNWGVCQRITGTIITSSDKSKFQGGMSRGDLYFDGVQYYVFKDGGSWANEPPSAQWYLIQ